MLSDRSLSTSVLRQLRSVVGDENVRTDRASRVAHAAGKSYPDLIRQRGGDCRRAPDAVVYPASHEAVRAVLEACAAAGVAVVPFGGGTSVVGGVDPVRDRFDAVVSLDVGRLREVVGVDRPSLTAVLEPGLRGPEVESALRGLSAGEREVIALRVVLDLDAPSAARVLGISTTNCTTRLNRALKKLEEALDVAA
jgi:alkyldihydroxyacetonephosphate synthase